MEISFNELKEREIINVFDGKKLGRAVDIIFEPTRSEILGFVVPGFKKGWLKKSDDLFVPFASIVKMGDDVLLVKLTPSFNSGKKDTDSTIDMDSVKKQMNDYYVNGLSDKPDFGYNNTRNFTDDFAKQYGNPKLN